VTPASEQVSIVVCQAGRRRQAGRPLGRWRQPRAALAGLNPAPFGCLPGLGGVGRGGAAHRNAKFFSVFERRARDDEIEPARFTRDARAELDRPWASQQPAPQVGLAGLLVSLSLSSPMDCTATQSVRSSGGISEKHRSYSRTRTSLSIHIPKLCCHTLSSRSHFTPGSGSRPAVGQTLKIGGCMRMCSHIFLQMCFGCDHIRPDVIWM
jgi:hypothetical protein